MRHSKHRHRIAGSPGHRRTLARNLAVEVLDHGKIKTTHTKCQFMRGYVEKLISMAKEDTVANRRLAYTRLNNRDAVNKLFTEVAPKFKNRPGGYTRILKLADARLGDGAPMSYLALVE